MPSRCRLELSRHTLRYSRLHRPLWGDGWAVVTARMITIAETTSFADLLAIATASQPGEERAKMAALPVMVHCARVLVLQGRHLP